MWIFNDGVDGKMRAFKALLSEDNGNFKIEQMGQTGAIKVFEYVRKFYKEVVFKKEEGNGFVLRRNQDLCEF